MKYFSDNLLFLRKKNKKKQQDIAASLGFTSSSRYSNYETGHSKPDLETLISLSGYFNVSIDHLLNTDLSSTNYLYSDQQSLTAVKEDELAYPDESMRRLNSVNYTRALEENSALKDEIIKLIKQNSELAAKLKDLERLLSTKI